MRFHRPRNAYGAKGPSRNKIYEHSQVIVPILGRNQCKRIEEHGAISDFEVDEHDEVISED